MNNNRSYIEYVVYLLFISISAAFLYTFFTNTLENNKQWKLGRSHYGSFQEINFFSSRQVLAGNELHLSLQGGFQEIYSQNTFPTKGIYFFSFHQVTPPEFYSFVFFRFGKIRVGFRISKRKELPSAFLVVDEDGSFLKKEILAEQTIPDEFRILFDSNNRSFFLNGDTSHAYRFSFSPPKTFDVGFKGGKGEVDRREEMFGQEKSVLIDDVELRNKKKILLSDSFTLFPHWITWSIAFTLSGLFLWGISYVKEGKEWVRVLLILLVISGIMFPFVISHRYFSFSHLSFTEQYKKDVMDKHQILLQRYMENPSKSSQKILVLGGSTAFGQGVVNPKDRWVEVVKQTLQKNRLDIDVINWGISASNSIHILNYLDEVIEAVHPTQLLFLIGVNDTDCYECLSKNLEIIHKKTEIQNIPIALIADSYADILYAHNELPYFKILREFSLRYKRVHFIETFNAWEKIIQEDRGILWSDDVHMTTFGQRELAKLITSSLRF